MYLQLKVKMPKEVKDYIKLLCSRQVSKRYYSVLTAIWHLCESYVKQKIITLLFISQIGLAVGDIADVQRNAELKRLAMQVDLHSDYEPKLPTKILEWVTKDNITIRPNSVCPTSNSAVLNVRLSYVFYWLICRELQNI